MKKKDLSGMKFGELTVIQEFPERKNGHIQWKCICDCGNEVVVKGIHLTSGHTLTCGCSRLQHLKFVNIKHGCTKTRLYNIWASIKSRCSNKNNKYYGGRGISICEEWKHSFVAFKEWALRHGYDDALSIDRIDNDGNYEPSNCRWATEIEQANNMSCNKKIAYKGECRTVSEWCYEYKLSKNAVYKHLRKGKSFYEILKLYEKI